MTNGEGAYYLPGLDPGIYDVRTELPGFAPTAREGVTLAINATITLDFRLALAGVAEAVTVTGAAPLIEVTQSKVASTIETTELQNLPMITRSVSGLLALLPGAAPMEALHRSKESVGSVSFGGASGSNNTSTVDGADNRDNRYGGPLMTFSTDALEQFQLSTSQFTAADGRTGGAAITMVTKSGTNVFHGTAFGFARDRSMTAKDYFAKAANEEKPPFSRQQFGGSIGGPILQNRMFFFGAVEQIYEDLQEPVGERQFDELELLVSATGAGRLQPGLVNPNHPRYAPTGGNLTLSSVKVNGQLSNNHSLMGRFAHQRDDRDAVTFTSDNDLREPENGTIRMWSAVGQHGWVLGNRGLNQITVQVNHLYRLSDVVSNITGEHYTRDFPNVDIFPPRLAFPSVNTGAGGAGGSLTDTYVIQLKDDVSLISGNHTMKFGGELQLSAQPGHAERERALRHAHVLRRSVGHPGQQQRPVSAGLRHARDRPPVAAGQRRRPQRCGLERRFADRRQAGLRLVPGRLACDVAPHVEPRRALRHRLPVLRPEELGEQRHATRPRGDWPSVRRAAEDPHHGHLPAPRLCLRPQRRWTAGGARRLRAFTSINTTPARRAATSRS